MSKSWVENDRSKFKIMTLFAGIPDLKNLKSKISGMFFWPISLVSDVFHVEFPQLANNRLKDTQQNI